MIKARQSATKKAIILATVHGRHDAMEMNLRARLPDHAIYRVSDAKKLNLELLEKIDPKWVFFPHWSWIIPEEVHQKFKCVVFHMTDLPFGRGGSPLQNLILSGYTETKMSALRCVNELDAGPVYLKKSLSLAGTAEEILNRAIPVIEDMIVEIVENDNEPEPQAGEIVEFKRRKPSDGDLSAVDSVEQLFDYIRMLDGEGYPNAFLETENLVFEFTSAVLVEDSVEARVRIRKKE